MSNYYSYCTYVESEGFKLFTMVCLPKSEGKFPTIIYRTPYADGEEFRTDAELIAEFENNHRTGLNAGYAYVYQHCRGRGKSSGDFIPYVQEREDTKALYSWIRQQPFYDGNLFLTGGSYTSSVHFVAAPFDDDIKGAVLCIQDYLYDPKDHARFRGGLSTAWGGADWQDEPNSREDIVSVYTPEFDEDTVIKGKMNATLRVKSDCEDTAFYMRISIRKADGDFGLRDDITQLSSLYPEYIPGDEVEVRFSFDDISFMVKKGEALRIDVSSSCFPTFLPHTNFRGDFATQRETRVANNTVFLDKSSLTVFAE